MEIKLGDNIKHLRERKGIDQQKLADILDVPRSTLACWENNIRTPKLEQIVKIANYFNTNLDIIYNNYNELNNTSNLSPIQLDRDVVKIPVLGKIPAGMPFEAIEDTYTVDFEEIPKEWLKGGKEYFALKLDGDSMEPEFKDKDTVIFLKTSSCQSGQYACVKVNGFDATFKEVKIQDNGILLSPLNLHNSTNYLPTFYTKNEIESLPVEIIGVVKRRIGDY